MYILFDYLTILVKIGNYQKGLLTFFCDDNNIK